MSSIFLINIFTALFAAGLIWTIQLVHYPSMRFVSKNEFESFHYFHQKRISIIAMPLMAIELISSIILLLQNFENNTSLIFKINFMIIILIWFSTFFMQVPLHQKLSKGKNDILIDKLVFTNWFRTVLWTLRSILMLFLLAFFMNLI